MTALFNRTKREQHSQLVLGLKRKNIRKTWNNINVIAFPRFLQQVVGTESNTLIFDIPNPKSNAASSTSSTKFSLSSGSSTSLNVREFSINSAPPSPRFHQQSVALLVCIEGDETKRAQLEHCIRETFRWVECVVFQNLRRLDGVWTKHCSHNF